MKPVAVIDLFCGMGGFSQGAIDGGAIVIIAVDSWDAAIAVHKDNHPDVPVWKMELGEENQWLIFKRLVDKWRELGFHVHIHHLVLAWRMEKIRN